MISNNLIKNCFSKAEVNLEFCWQVLVDLKNVNLESDDFPGRFIKFQDVLATTIFNLQKVRDQIILEEKKIVLNKVKYKIDWFKARLRTLAAYKEGIDQVVNICKGLGDAYSYYFYQNDLELFTNHLGHERVINHCAGMGERGELEFLRNAKHIESYFTLYHGNTNILRYGDFSFIDLKNLKVVRIGELKTSQVDEHTLNLQLHMIGRKQVRHTSKNIIEDQEMKRTRRGRQMLGIINFLKGDQIQTKVSKSIQQNTYANDIDKLVKKSKVGAEEFKQVSQGLAFFSIKFRRGTLYQKIFKRKFQGMSEVAENKLISTATALLKKDSPNNSIIYSMLLYGKKLSHKAIPGTVPIFWSPLSATVLKNLYFLDATVFSIFNPTHLIESIHTMDFNVESKYVKYNDDNKNPKNTIQGFDLFIPYINSFMFTENFVIDAIRSVTNFAVKNKKKLTSINIQQHINIFDSYIKDSKLRGIRKEKK